MPAVPALAEAPVEIKPVPETVTVVSVSVYLPGLSDTQTPIRLVFGPDAVTTSGQ